MLVPFSAAGITPDRRSPTRFAVAWSEGADLAIALKYAVVPALLIWTGVTAATSAVLATSACSVCSRGSLGDWAGEPSETATSSGPFESAAVEGIQTFNGDGTGTVTGSGLVLQFFALSPPWGVESPVNFTFSFTYTVNAHSTWTSVGGPVTSTVTGGPRKGQTVTFNGFPLTGRISINGMTLTAVELTPTVETITFSNGDVDHRTCQRSWVHISLQQ